MQMNTSVTAISEQFTHHCKWMETVFTNHQTVRWHHCTGESDRCNILYQNIQNVLPGF